MTERESCLQDAALHLSQILESMISDDEVVLSKLQKGGAFDVLRGQLSEQLKNDVRLSCV